MNTNYKAKTKVLDGSQTTVVNRLALVATCKYMLIEWNDGRSSHALLIITPCFLQSTLPQLNYMLNLYLEHNTVQTVASEDKSTAG